MKSHILVILAGLAFCLRISAQDTFSICAFDPETGQVGSAGATCIESSLWSAIIISDVHPGVGVVHTQAYWISGNQDYGHELMASGLSAQQIVDSLVANDIQSDATYRQYGVVRLGDGGESAGYTGVNTDDYKNHILGPNYAIQGNILLGQQILDSMETRFNNTEGDLACKLMAALQGAKVVGADTRCADDGTSSFSAFVRVANPEDDPEEMALDLTINTYAEGTEPIDSLQALFDAVGGCAWNSIPEIGNVPLFISCKQGSLEVSCTSPMDEIVIFQVSGIEQFRQSIQNSNKVAVSISTWPVGVYLVRVRCGQQWSVKKWEHFPDSRGK